MNHFKFLLWTVAAQIIFSLGWLIVQVASLTSQSKCQGDAQLCQSLASTTNDQTWMVVGVMVVFGLTALGFTALTARLQNRIMAGIVALAEVLVTLGNFQTLVSGKGNLVVNLLVLGLSAGALVYAVLATVRRRPVA